MPICYWCYWGWPQPIREIYDDAKAELNCDTAPLHFGPAHIVWEDENWDCAQWCLDHFDEYRGDWSEGALAIVRESLERLVAVPDEYKTEPAGYDGQHPENFPPPREWHCERY